MAKKAKKSIIKEAADTIKSQAIELNQASIEIADDIVEASIKNGAKWQKVFAKVLKNGTVILGQQQELVLDTLEELKGQYVESGNRLVELVELDDKNVSKIKDAIKNVLNLEKVIEKTAKKFKESITGGSSKIKKAAKSKVSKAKKTAKKKKIAIDSLMEKATKSRKAANKKAKASAKKTGKKVTAKKASTVKAAKKATSTKVVKSTPAKAVKRVTKPTTKKVVTKKATTAKVVKATPAKKVATKKAVKTIRKAAPKKVTSNDLKAIEGIGPKIEGILKSAGITTYKQLSTSKIQDLKNILKAAGPRYSLANPSTWKQQARLAAGEKWNDLISLQATLKGGK